MKKIILLLFIPLLMLSSCKKMTEKEKDTIARITLKDSNGNLLTGWKVYAYAEHTWNIYGPDPGAADKTVVTDNSGIAKFYINDIYGMFQEQRQETVYFAVYYTIGNNNDRHYKSIAITFEKGDDKTGQIHL